MRIRSQVFCIPSQQLLLEPSCLEWESEHGKFSSSQQSHYPTNICQVPTTCYVQAYFYFYLMDEKLRPEKVGSFVHQKVSEHQEEGSMMTGAPCNPKPSSVNMNFLWAALKEGGHKCQFRHCQRHLAGNVLLVLLECAFQDCWIQRPE